MSNRNIPEFATDSVVTDLNSVMQPVTEETPEDHAVLTDLNAVMQPVTDTPNGTGSNPDVVVTDLGDVMETDTNDTFESELEGEQEALPPRDEPEPLDTEAVMASYEEAMKIATGPIPGSVRGDYDPDYEVEHVTEMEHEEILDAEGNVIEEESVSFDAIEALSDQLEAQSVSGDNSDSEPIPYIGDGPVPYVSPKSPVSQRFRHYIQTRWYPQWKYYDQRAAFNKTRHINLQVFIALGSVSVPILIGISFMPTWVPALISGMVAAFTAIENVMKYGDNWRAYRSAAEGLNREKVLYEAMSGPYKNTKAPFRMFVERCEDIVAEETGRFIERNEEAPTDSEINESDVSSSDN